MSNNIACVLVTYNPNKNLLEKLIIQLKQQVDSIVIVDNSPFEKQLLKIKSPRIVTLYNENKNGIAGAQNKALKFLLKEKKSKYIVFLDQDSEISNHFITDLANNYFFLEKQNIPVGAIGALPINKKTQKKYVYKIISSINDKLDCTDMLISSSLFTSIQNLKKVELMNEKLFIDFVDHDWCWRATHVHSLKLYICKNITFQHQLGNDLFRFGPFLFVKCTPFRSYFVARNSLLLLRKKYVPQSFKIKSVIRVLIMPWIYLFQKEGKTHFKRIFLGIKDGVLNQ